MAERRDLMSRARLWWYFLEVLSYLPTIWCLGTSSEIRSSSSGLPKPSSDLSSLNSSSHFFNTGKLLTPWGEGFHSRPTHCTEKHFLLMLPACLISWTENSSEYPAYCRCTLSCCHSVVSFPGWTLLICLGRIQPFFGYPCCMYKDLFSSVISFLRQGDTRTTDSTQGSRTPQIEKLT